MLKTPVSAVIVAGGEGARMRAVSSDLPKPMLTVRGKPLLEHQLLWLKSWGITELVLCLGYKADAIARYFGDGSAWGLKLRYQIEKTQRGTAGAVRDALPFIRHDDILVVYGDLFIAMDCGKFIDFHSAHSGAASLVLWESDHPLDSDLVRRDGDRITGFYRAQPGQSYENLACAAVWAVRRPLLDLAPADKPSDFGRDVFPQALSRGLALWGYRTNEAVVDLGTPERLEAFLGRGKSA